VLTWCLGANSTPKAGVSPDNLYLHGNNKSVAELILAIDSGCTIVVDNWQELHTLWLCS